MTVSNSLRLKKMHTRIFGLKKNEMWQGIFFPLCFQLSRRNCSDILYQDLNFAELGLLIHICNRDAYLLLNIAKYQK